MRCRQLAYEQRLSFHLKVVRTTTPLFALGSAYRPLLEQRQRRDVFDQEVEIQIAAKARHPLQGVFVTMMDTRCRPGEVLALRWEDILWDLDVIFVRQGKDEEVDPLCAYERSSP